MAGAYNVRKGFKIRCKNCHDHSNPVALLHPNPPKEGLFTVAGSLREAAKKVPPLMCRPLRGVGGGGERPGVKENKTFFLTFFFFFLPF